MPPRDDTRMRPQQADSLHMRVMGCHSLHQSLCARQVSAQSGCVATSVQPA